MNSSSKLLLAVLAFFVLASSDSVYGMKRTHDGELDHQTKRQRTDHEAHSDQPEILSPKYFGGPVYAAKWAKESQVVLLYGDNHAIQHECTTVPECMVCQAIEALWQDCNLITDNALILYEGCGLSSNKIYSSCDLMKYQAIQHEGKMPFLGSLAHHLSDVDIQDVDLRNEFSLVRMALQYCQGHTMHYENTQKQLLHENRMAFYKKVYEAIKHRNIAEVFQQPISMVKNFAQCATDNVSEGIFNEIACTIEKRQDLFWKILSNQTGIASDDLNAMTPENIAERISLHNNYWVLAKFLCSPAVSQYYALEAVEGAALSLIMHKESHKNIIFFAGNNHIQNIEKYLLMLGFSKIKSAGSDYALAQNECKKAQLMFGSLVDQEHFLRVYPLDPLDNFGQFLFIDKIENAINGYALSSKTNPDNEIEQAKSNMLEKVKIQNTCKSSVQYQAFEWIKDFHQSN